MNYPQTALIVVDAQCGFSEECPAELPVPGALALVPVVNRLLALPFARIDATQDWHPSNHCSFQAQGGPYPPHCLADRRGSDFWPGLRTERFTTIWRKGIHPHREAYAITAEQPGYAPFLGASGIATVVLCGVARNICVHWTGRDLALAGFQVVLVTDASAGIDLPSAGLFQSQALTEAQSLGFAFHTVHELEQLA